MTTIGGPAGRTRAAAGETATVAGVGTALVTAAYLHVSGIGVVDPLDHTISDYVFLPGGYALLGLAALALAATAAVLARGLRGAALPDPRPPVALLLSGSAALVLVALFPTNPPGTAAGLAATVHRIAGGWVLVALPLAGRLVARRSRTASGWTAGAPALTWCAGVAGVISAGFLLSHLPIVVGGSSGLPLLGGVERVLYAAVMVVLVAIARATRLAVDAALGTVPAPSGVRGAA